jgi:CrcB protein
VTRVVLVALGGAIGSVARYGMQSLAAQVLGPTFPWGTLMVNLTGSFLIALLMHVALTGTAISLELRIFLATGVMGGFTTYSSFNWETMSLAQEGRLGAAALYLAFTLAGCVAAGLAGIALVHRIVG